MFNKHFKHSNSNLLRFLEAKMLSHIESALDESALFKIEIFVNKQLKIFHFVSQSSSHYVIKSETKANFPALACNIGTCFWKS